MLLYFVRRLFMSLLVALLAISLLAGLVHFIPGDPVRVILGPRATPAKSAEVRAEMELDKPIPVQIWNFTRRALGGDLGKDFVSHRPVTAIVGEALPHTLVLAIGSLTLAALIGIPLGVYSATHPNSLADRVSGFIAVGFITLPSYVAGLFLLLLFAVQLNWSPAIGAGDWANPRDYLRHLVLPLVALAVTWVGYLARLVRASMLEALTADYIRTAFAHGLPKRIIYYQHALKNALIPTVAVLGVGLGNLLGGAVFVEIIFTRPGLGRLIVDAIASRNYPVVRGGVLAAALLFVVANLLADLVIQWLDPRIQFEEGST